MEIRALKPFSQMDTGHMLAGETAHVSDEVGKMLVQMEYAEPVVAQESDEKPAAKSKK